MKFLILLACLAISQATTCYSSAVSGTNDDALVSVSCPSGETALTCECIGDGCEGAFFASGAHTLEYYSGAVYDEDVCVGHHSGSGSGITAQICCESGEAESSNVVSAANGQGCDTRANLASYCTGRREATCPDGYTATGCSCDSFWKGCPDESYYKLDGNTCSFDNPTQKSVAQVRCEKDAEEESETEEYPIKIGCWEEDQIPGWPQWSTAEDADTWYAGYRLSGDAQSLRDQCAETCSARGATWFDIHDTTACFCGASTNEYSTEPASTDALCTGKNILYQLLSTETTEEPTKEEEEEQEETTEELTKEEEEEQEETTDTTTSKTEWSICPGTINDMFCDYTNIGHLRSEEQVVFFDNSEATSQEGETAGENTVWFKFRIDDHASALSIRLVSATSGMEDVYFSVIEAPGKNKMCKDDITQWDQVDSTVAEADTELESVEVRSGVNYYLQVSGEAGCGEFVMVQHY